MFTAILPILGTLVDRLIPDKAEAQKVMDTLATQTIEADKQQNEVNKAEISTGRLGWRWAMGWLCVISLGHEWLFRPYMEAYGVAIPPISTEAQWVIITGMLGLSSVRAHDLLRKTRK